MPLTISRRAQRVKPSPTLAVTSLALKLKAEGKEAPLYYHYLSTFASSFDQWDSVQTVNFPRGHGILKSYMALRPRYCSARSAP